MFFTLCLLNAKRKIANMQESMDLIVTLLNAVK